MAIQITETRRFAPGTLIMKEGDQPHEAYVIRSGTAEILKTDTSGDEVILGVLEDGEIFGEMGLILDRPRSTSVRARTALVVDVVDPSSFTSLFESDVGQQLRPIVQILCERLRVADAHRADLENKLDETAGDSEEDPIPLAVTIAAKNARAAATMGKQSSVDVEKFPFRVGRYSDDPDQRFFHVNDLYLHDVAPSRISQSHFALVRGPRTCYFQDRGSKNGSIVNGAPVGGAYDNPTRIPLKIGRNTIRVGGAKSKFVYTITVAVPGEKAPALLDRLRLSRPREQTSGR